MNTISVKSLIALVLSLTIASYVGVSSAERTPAEMVDSLIKGNDIAIFAKSYCPFCKKVVKAFEDLGVETGTLNMDLEIPKQMSAVQDELMDRVGRRTVPQVFIFGKHLGGADDTIAAINSGKLKAPLALAKENQLKKKREF